jgi:SAM-dependent MidA family methyltransferase
MDRIAESLERGHVFIIDYGYDARELVRFPQGTLMSYRRHQALDDVLESPGERDITAHVNFTELTEQARSKGFSVVRYSSMARFLLDTGERDQFAAALAGATEVERTRHRLQLKSLLFGMGEVFRVLLLRKEHK